MLVNKSICVNMYVLTINIKLRIMYANSLVRWALFVLMISKNQIIDNIIKFEILEKSTDCL